MSCRPERAREVLSLVDPARLRSGWPVGLRDGAMLALLAAGLTAQEISRLRAAEVTVTHGKLQVSVPRHGATWSIVLPADLGGRLLVWLTDRRLWAERTPVFHGPWGSLTPRGIYRILDRYWSQRRRARRC